MNILLTCKHYAVASGRYMHDALLRAGHEVRTLGPAMGVDIWGIQVDEKWAWVPNAPAQDWEPDLVIHMDATWIWQPPEKRFGDCPHVVYGVDNHVQKYDHVFEPDHLFLAHGGGYRIGEPNVTHLPCAYDPVWFTPGKPWHERQYDLALIGWMNSDRNTAIYAIQNQFGAPFAYGLGPIYDGFADVYQNAKISVVVSVAGDVAQRVFETAAMGCLVVMDEAHDGEVLGLKDGENCLIYPRGDYDAMTKAIGWALANPEDAAKIAQAGQQWAAPHTWDARAAFITDWAEHERQPEKPKRKSAPKQAEKAQAESDD